MVTVIGPEASVEESTRENPLGAGAPCAPSILPMLAMSQIGDPSPRAAAVVKSDIKEKRSIEKVKEGFCLKRIYIFPRASQGFNADP